MHSTERPFKCTVTSVYWSSAERGLNHRAHDEDDGGDDEDGGVLNERFTSSRTTRSCVVVNK